MSLEDAVQDYNDYAEDVFSANYQSFANTFKRFMSLFHPTEPLGTLAEKLLPAVDFDGWYQLCLASRGGMAGSGTLAWPELRRERVALQLELFRRIARDQIDAMDFCHDFANPDVNDFNFFVTEFNTQVFRPFVRDFARALQAATRHASPPPTAEPPPPVPHLIDDERIDQLRAVRSSSHDLTRLVRLCEELNSCYSIGAYFAVIVLTRAILDHVPPLLGQRTFQDVASQYGGARSFREAMDHLQNGARKIADAHLHLPIRENEVLPNAVQVNFSQYLDFLLAEIVRVAK